MRKEFLKQLMEAEGEPSSGNEGDGSSEVGRAESQANADPEPEVAQEPLPQGEELKKYMQRFLFFINGIRVLIKSTEQEMLRSSMQSTKMTISQILDPLKKLHPPLSLQAMAP